MTIDEVWAASGDGTPASPKRWTCNRTVIEKHPFTAKFMVIVDGELAGIVESLPAAQTLTRKQES